MSILSLLDKFRRKPAEPFVWVLTDPHKPHRGLDKFSDRPKAEFWPCTKVNGITLSEARSQFMGKVIEYKRIPRSKLFDLTEGDLSITMKVDEFQKLFR